MVPDSQLSLAQRAQIEDIVKRKTGIAAEQIVITPLSESSEDTAEGTEAESDTEAADSDVIYEEQVE